MEEVQKRRNKGTPFSTERFLEWKRQFDAEMDERERKEKLAKGLLYVPPQEDKGKENNNNNNNNNLNSNINSNNNNNASSSSSSVTIRYTGMEQWNCIINNLCWVRLYLFELD